MTLNKPIIFFLLLPCLWSCQPSAPQVAATNHWQISEQVIVDGKLSAQGEYTSLLLANNSLEQWHNKTRQKVSAWANEQLVPNTYLLESSATAQYLLSASKTAVQIWHTEYSQALGRVDLSSHLGDAKITAIRFWSPPHRFFIGTSSGDVIFADTETDTYRVNRHHSSDVTKLALSQDGHTLFSGGNDGRVAKWDLLNYRPMVSKRLPHRVVSLALADDGLLFLSDALNQHILWDSEQNTVVGQINHWKRFKWFRQALLYPQHSWLITSSPKTDMYIWHLDDLQMQGSWTVETQTMGSAVADLVLMDKGKLRTLTTDAVLQDWDLRPFEKIVTADVKPISQR